MILGKHSCCLQKQMNIELQAERLYTVQGSLTKSLSFWGSLIIASRLFHWLAVRGKPYLIGNCFYYEWAKRMKFLLAVIYWLIDWYGLPRLHSISYNTSEKNRKKLKYIFMSILDSAESFKTMNRPDPTWPELSLFDGLLIGKFKRE